MSKTFYDKDGIRRRICASTVFLAVIAYILIGYFTDVWTWSLFVFLVIPVMPVLLGLKRLHISYEFLVLAAYLTIGFSTHQWHPWWVLFLTIPVFHILFRHPVVEIRHDDDDDDKKAEIREGEYKEKE